MSEESDLLSSANSRSMIGLDRFRSDHKNRAATGAAKKAVQYHANDFATLSCLVQQSRQPGEVNIPIHAKSTAAFRAQALHLQGVCPLVARTANPNRESGRVFPCKGSCFRLKVWISR